MAITVLPRQGSFGQDISTGLGEGLRMLAEHKMGQTQQRIAQQRAATGLEQLGFNPQEAYGLSGLDPNLQREVVKQRLSSPGNQAYLSALQELLGGSQSQQSSPSQQLPAQSAIGQPSTSTSIGLGQPAGINQQQATKLAELGLKKQQSESSERGRQQRHIENRNAPVLKQIEEKGIPARKITSLGKDILDILDTGKAFTGVTGKFTPTVLQSPEGQVLASKINELVLQKAQLGKGVPSRMRLTLEELAKPAIWQRPKAIRKLINDMLEDQEIQKDIAQDIAREEILEQNENQPKNIRSLIAKRAKEIVQQQKQNKNVFTELPPASKFEGKIARNPSTGQRMRSVNGQWVEIPQGE